MEYRIIRIRIIRRRRELDGDRIMCRGNAGENRAEKESDSSRSRGCKENGGFNVGLMDDYVRTIKHEEIREDDT